MKLGALISNTFREAVRDKVLLTLIVMALAVTAGARLIPSLAAGEEIKIIKDLGLKSITLFCVLIAVLVGGRLVWKEVEKRTIHVMLAKPVARWQFILGKYLGLMLVLLTSVAIMTVWFGLFALISRVPLTPRLLIPILLLIFQLGIITAIAVLFSTFVTPISGAVFTLAFYLTGNMSNSLLYWGTKDKPPVVKAISYFFYYLIPNLQNLDTAPAVVHNLPLDPARILLSIAYSLVYIAAILILAIIIFQRRNL